MLGQCDLADVICGSSPKEATPEPGTTAWAAQNQAFSSNAVTFGAGFTEEEMRTDKALAFLPLPAQKSMGFKADDPNLFRYVGNNATNATDPSGLEMKIGNTTIDQNSDAYKRLKAIGPVAEECMDIMIKENKAGQPHKYSSEAALRLELEYRTKIVDAANKLADSKVTFTLDKSSLMAAEKSKNWDLSKRFYGHPTDKTIFSDAITLKKGAKLSEGVNELFDNSENYQLDCASAAMLCLLKGKIDYLRANAPERLAKLDDKIARAGQADRGFPIRGFDDPR